MQFKVTTVYENIDEQFLTDFVSKAPPTHTPIMLQLMKNGTAKFSSKDPDGPQRATTTYEIIEGENGPAATS